MSRNAKHRKPRPVRTWRERVAFAANTGTVIAAAMIGFGVIATSTASAADTPHGHYTLVRTEFTPAYVAAFRDCWQANTPTGDWSALEQAEAEHRLNRAFYAEHPAALTAFRSCQASVPVETTTTTRVVNY